MTAEQISPRELDVVHAGPLQRSPKPLEDVPHSPLRVVDARQVGEVRVVRELLEREHLAVIRRAPAKDHSHLVDLIPEPAREDEVPDPEALEQLRYLSGMSEAIGEVADRRSFAAEPLAHR